MELVPSLNIQLFYFFKAFAIAHRQNPSLTLNMVGGYDDEYCNVCLTHSYLNNDIVCTAGGVPNPKDNPFLTKFIKNHEYTIEEKLINLCDLMCPQGNKVFTIDKRLIDIMIRRGAYSNTQYHIKETYKLKEYFDNLLGYNLYDLFPKIKENL